jgi:hypothetical protein
MRLYINDASLQGQFTDALIFESLLQDLIASRARIENLRRSLRTTRQFTERMVAPGRNVRSVVQRSRSRDLRNAILAWLDRNGPFVDDDRTPEIDDYFEYAGMLVTDSGLGEAARRVKNGDHASTFSFAGGAVDFAVSPLLVDHGLVEERLGQYPVTNVWTVADLVQLALSAGPSIASWRALVEAARVRFPHLVIPDSVYENPNLSREPFEISIGDRALELLGYLNEYTKDRGVGGAEGPIARSIIAKHFVGERALFSGESPSNQRAFRRELTFVDPLSPSQSIFAHWHGKISHRFFRIHFEWPLSAERTELKVVYLGPKLTKD